MKRYQLQVTGEWGGEDGNWRPAITGDLNQTGGSDNDASTFDTEEYALAIAIAHIEPVLPASRWRIEIVGTEELGEPVGAVSVKRAQWLGMSAAASGGAIFVGLPYHVMRSTTELLGDGHMLAVGELAAERRIPREAVLEALNSDLGRCRRIQLHGAAAQISGLLTRLEEATT